MSALSTRWLAIVLVAIVVTVVAAACGGGGEGGVAAPSASPSPRTSLASDTTRAEIATALGARSIGMEKAQSPYRPAESPLVAAAPRLVLEAYLPGDPGKGQIVVYEFLSAGDADRAGREFARYIASGPGRVNFTPDAVFVLREFGQTLVFYTYSPGSMVDAAAAGRVAEALADVGSGIDMPS